MTITKKLPKHVEITPPFPNFPFFLSAPFTYIRLKSVSPKGLVRKQGSLRKVQKAVFSLNHSGLLFSVRWPYASLSNFHHQPYPINSSPDWSPTVRCAFGLLFPVVLGNKTRQHQIRRRNQIWVRGGRDVIYLDLVGVKRSYTYEGEGPSAGRKNGEEDIESIHIHQRFVIWGYQKGVQGKAVFCYKDGFYHIVFDVLLGGSLMSGFSFFFLSS